MIYEQFSVYHLWFELKFQLLSLKRLHHQVQGSGDYSGQMVWNYAQEPEVKPYACYDLTIYFEVSLDIIAYKDL